MPTIVLQQPQQVNRRVLIAAALAHGLNNTAQALFSIAQRKQEAELKREQLAQQYELSKDRIQQSRERMDLLTAYRQIQLTEQREGRLSREEMARQQLGLQQDLLDYRKENDEANRALRRDIAEARALEKASGDGGKGGHELRLSEAMTDLFNLENGKPLKYLPEPTTPRQRNQLRKTLKGYMNKKSEWNPRPLSELGQIFQGLGIGRTPGEQPAAEPDPTVAPPAAPPPPTASPAAPPVPKLLPGWGIE